MFIIFILIYMLIMAIVLQGHAEQAKAKMSFFTAFVLGWALVPIAVLRKLMK